MLRYKIKSSNPMYQSFHSTYEAAVIAAKGYLSSPNAGTKVEIWEITETLLRTVERPTPESSQNPLPSIE